MIESLSTWPSVHRRHVSAPLLKEREQYLTHLLQKGVDRRKVLGVASFLIHIVRTMELSSLRMIELTEIEQAGERWTNFWGPERSPTQATNSPIIFVTVARQWLHFHGQLILPAPSIGPFDAQLADFRSALELRRLSPVTVTGYVNRTRNFLRWFSERHHDFSLVTVSDVDDYLAGRRAAGWHLATLACQCLAIRSFFAYLSNPAPVSLWNRRDAWRSHSTGTQ